MDTPSPRCVFSPQSVVKGGNSPTPCGSGRMNSRSSCSRVSDRLLNSAFMRDVIRMARSEAAVMSWWTSEPDSTSSPLSMRSRK